MPFVTYQIELKCKPESYGSVSSEQLTSEPLREYEWLQLKQLPGDHSD